ncbi:hypothetical protein TVAG_267080 [Trichomonas vaginalis G3]|uniref:Uncharacterized protein n=1 Tax=Trichomonas vaginalis (strain ATCC PRA-98 / G3) TaxID=412133 RepID=A2F546_TRIV3|nr:hypothetical protein TVAG_267080 [Trichomonas vaginalis G3]|eukprot:XP_001312869.1 hypothetical protein [Trichomonas vaginalis G3]
MESENPFQGQPASSAMENSFRMAQVLQRKKDYKVAIEKYINICLNTEKIVAMNPTAHVELQWPALSLGYIADIYHEKEDLNKEIAFRTVQNELLDFMRNMKHEATSTSDSDDGDIDFIEIATVGQQYQRIFKRIHEAIDLPEAPPKLDIEKFIKDLQEARQKDEEARIESAIRQINEANEEREREIQNSFWKRNLQRIIDHPVIFTMVLLFLSTLVVAYVHFKPNIKPKSTRSMEQSLSIIQNYLNEYEAKNGKKGKGGGFMKSMFDNLLSHDHEHDHDHHHHDHHHHHDL